MSSHESNSGCPDCGHALMEHGPSGCTHGLHGPVDSEGFLHVCGCRRGRHDPLDEEAEQVSRQSKFRGGRDGW